MIIVTTIQRVSEVPDLMSAQQEADTKVFLCARYASSLGFNRVRIATVDSDVGVLSLYYKELIQANLILEFGSGSKEMIYDIDGADIPAQLAKALPALHALSGCDSTSSFSGIGKKKCLQVLKSDQRFIEAACLLGENAAIPNVVLKFIE